MVALAVQQNNQMNKNSFFGNDDYNKVIIVCKEEFFYGKEIR